MLHTIADLNNKLNALGAVHMSRASPANWADLSHENLYFLKTQRFI